MRGNDQSRNSATVFTSHGAYRVAPAEKAAVEKMRSSVLGLMRRANQQFHLYRGTEAKCGAEHPATVARREQLAASRAKLAAKEAALRETLERIERECEPVAAPARVA